MALRQPVPTCVDVGQVESQLTANQLEALRRMLGSSVERSDAVAQVGNEAAAATAVGA